MRLEHSSWAQVREYFAENDTVVIPVGSTENHGSHLGMGTDFIVPNHLLDLIGSHTKVLSIPALPFGMADHHMGFDGTLSIGLDGLHMVLSRIAGQLYRYGARRFIFLNGHGGNDPAINRVGLEIAEMGGLSAILDWWVIAGQLNPKWKGGHGGAEETSAMMAINPEYVHMDYAKEFHPKDLSGELTFAGGSAVNFQGIKVTVPRTVVNFSEAGWYGDDDIQTATAEWGEEMLSETARFCADFIDAFRRVSLPENTSAQESIPGSK